jgi:hypothetical protein
MTSKYIGRWVVALSPLFLALAGAVTAAAAKYMPGAPPLDPLVLAGLFSTGTLAGAGLIFKWLDNRGKHERTVAVAPGPNAPATLTLTLNPSTQTYEIATE